MKAIRRRPDRAYLDNWLWVPKQHMNVEGTKSALSFAFTDSYSESRIRYLYLWREAPRHLLVPRSFWKPEELPYPIVDCRPRQLKSVKFTSHIKLDHLPDEHGVLQPTGLDTQQKALDAMLRAPGGILQLACGKGKTVVFLELVAQMGVPALVIVPDTHLMEQWERQANALLDIPGGIGYIQAERYDWNKSLVLATYHSIASKAEQLRAEGAQSYFGVIGWDEGHHVSAPTFAPGAELFFGRRYALTATPIREDGTHIVYEYHIGPVLFKDLSATIKPRVVFKWTGLEIDETQPDAKVRDKNGELHISKITSYYGKWKTRLGMILNDVNEAIKAGRQRILVLSYSIGEVANLCAMMTYGAGAPLYTDLPVPVPTDVGETLNPAELSKMDLKKLPRMLKSVESQLASRSLNPTKEANLKAKVVEIKQRLKQHEVFVKIEREMAKRQRDYIKALRKDIGNAGLMIHEVPAKMRASYVKKCQVVFAIMKYGKEGLDAPDLDAVIVCEPFSQRNGLQQVMGRTVRERPGKMRPVILFYEDKVGPILGMCKKLKAHLSGWAHEEGGPFDYEVFGAMNTRQSWNSTSQQIFGP